MKKIKNTLLGISLFYIGIYIPIALMAYIPYWYIFNCELHPFCNRIGYPNALGYIYELNDFLLHRSNLSHNWTMKERLHLSEVRDILDVLAVAAILGIIILIAFFKKSKISTYARVNLVITLSLLLILPFFKNFWIKAFHPLFFDNNLWQTNTIDVCFYIMPRDFFKHSTIFLISFSTVINGLLWLFFRKHKGNSVKKEAI